MGEHHNHDWRRIGPLVVRKGGVRERCLCGAKRLRRIVRCPDCSEARLEARYLYSARYDADPGAPACETCDGRGWCDAVAPDPQTLCCCYRFAEASERCANCRYTAHRMETHNCDVIAAEADAAWRERQADALLDPPTERRRATPEGVARANEIGW